MRRHIEEARALIRASNAHHVVSVAIMVQVINSLQQFLMVRMLHPEDVGHMRLITNTLNILVLFGTVTLPTAYLKFGSEHKDPNLKLGYFNTTLFAVFVVALIVSLVCSFAFRFQLLNDKSAGEYLVWMVFLLVPTSLFQVMSLKPQTEMNNKGYALINISGSVFKFILVIGGIAFLGFMGWMVGFSLSITLTTGILILIHWRSNAIDWERFNSRSLRAELVPFASWGFISGLFSTVINYSDALIIDQVMGNPVILAHYHVAALFYTAMLVVPSAIAQAAFPFVTALSDQLERVWTFTKKMYLVCSGIGIAFLLFNIAFGKKVITIMFGDSYSSSGKILIVLSVAFIFYSINTISGVFRVAVGRNDLAAKWYFPVGVFYLLSVLILAKTLGVIGIAVALCLTWAFSTVLGIWLWKKMVRREI